MFVGLNNETSGNEEFALCPSLIFEEEDLYLEGLGWCGKIGRKANHPDPGFCTTFLHCVNFCSEFNTIKITHRRRNGREVVSKSSNSFSITSVTSGKIGGRQGHYKIVHSVIF